VGTEKVAVTAILSWSWKLCGVLSGMDLEIRGAKGWNELSGK
jgi:hypothetical protein